MSEKPNVIFWTLVFVGAVSVFLFIYSLVVSDVPGYSSFRKTQFV